MIPLLVQDFQFLHQNLFLGDKYIYKTRRDASSMRPLTIVSYLLLLLSSLIVRATIIKGRLVTPTISASFLHGTTSTVRKTQLLRRNARLRLETSPLIGGPSWLPLHIKVLFEMNDLIHANGVPSLSLQHQWDLLPVDPTKISTLTKLTTLQYVPAQIRYRAYATSQYNNNTTGSNTPLKGLLYTITYDSETLDGMSESIVSLIGDRMKFNSDDGTSSLHRDDIPWDNFYHIDHDLAQKAHKFCILYMLRNNMEMHVLTNNCWTFALQLIFHLLTSDKQSK